MFQREMKMQKMVQMFSIHTLLFFFPHHNQIILKDAHPAKFHIISPIIKIHSTYLKINILSPWTHSDDRIETCKLNTQQIKSEEKKFSRNGKNHLRCAQFKRHIFSLSFVVANFLWNRNINNVHPTHVETTFTCCDRLELCKLSSYFYRKRGEHGKRKIMKI